MRGSTRTAVVNRDFDPTGQERQVLNVFRDEYQVNPLRIRDVTGLRKQRVNEALQQLEAAGWVENVNRGLWRLVYDGDCEARQDIRCKGEDPRGDHRG